MKGFTLDALRLLRTLFGIPFKFLWGFYEGGMTAAMLVLDEAPLEKRANAVKDVLFMGAAPRYILFSRWIGFGFTLFMGSVSAAIGALHLPNEKAPAPVAISND